MSSRRVRRRCWIAAAATIGAMACGNNLEFNEVVGSVTTVVDSGPALFSARTFVLPDTVVEVPLADGSISHAFDHQILASVRRHFRALGWTDLGTSPSVHPDVLVLVAASTRIETGVAYGGWFGTWGYLPYWGPSVDASWSWGVPGDAIAYSYQAGTVLITMLDLRAPRDTTKRIPLLWAAAVDGAVSSVAVTVDRALTGIDQAFAQSEYLRVLP